MFVEQLIINENNIHKVEEFLSQYGLTYDSKIDFLVCIRHNNKIIGVGAKKKNLLKMVAIDPLFKGQGLTSKVVDTLKSKAFKEGFESTCLITQSKWKELFCSLGFNELVEANNYVLLEEGFSNYKNWISSVKAVGESASIVMNCNPMTKGHLELIKKASSENSSVIVFLVEEDESEINFDIRFEIVNKNIKKFKNVQLVPSGNYIISKNTFPTYFDRKKSNMNKLWANIDAKLFIKIASDLNIVKRYVGTEPYSESTKQYNNALMSAFKDYSIELIIIERFKINNQPISASTLRKVMKKNNIDLINQLTTKETVNILNKYGLIKK